MAHNHDDILWRIEAVNRVLSLRQEELEKRAADTIDLKEPVTGRVLAEDLTADRDVPAHDHATMDGFAFDATESYPLTIRNQEVFPEDEPPRLDAGEAVPIATGGPLPERANAVLKVEEADVGGNQLRGKEISPGTYTYERGSNVEAGETLFEAGECLSAKDVVLLADVGVTELTVIRPFSTGLLATGTEIHEGRSDDLDSPMLAELLHSWGHDPHYEGSVPDEYDRVESAIADVAERQDVVITTGGTSVGKKDHVIRALEELGEVLFHRVRVRPGKPIAVARLNRYDAIAFAIPGKPIGAHTITSLVMRPFFTGADASLPSTEKTVACDLDVAVEGFEYAVPVVDDGKQAVPLGHVDSPLSIYDETFDPSVLSSSTRATRADGFFVTESGVSAGETVEVVPYEVIE